MLWRKSGASASVLELGMGGQRRQRLRAGRVAVHQHEREPDPVPRRSASVWAMMMSRNERPSRASTSDFGRWSPIVVASPPLSLITAKRIERPGVVGIPQLVERGNVARGLELVAANHGGLSVGEPPIRAGEAAGRLLGLARIAHLLLRLPQSGVAHASDILPIPLA